MESLKTAYEWITTGGAGACLPFFMLVKDGGHQQLNLMRIVEAIIIALIAGAFSAYVILQTLQVEVKGLKEDVKEIKEDVDSIKIDFYRPVYENNKNNKQKRK